MNSEKIHSKYFYINLKPIGLALLSASFLFLGLGCNGLKKDDTILFSVLEAKRTGLYFENKLTPTPDFNMFKYMYFYNGAGLGAGDFNNDGLSDLFFTSNQGQNKMYINKGGLQFEDVTTAAQIPIDSSWSTGVSVIDINNDGLLDLYVSRVGNYEKLQSHNQFLICQGLDSNRIPIYKDEAEIMGLNFAQFGTQAAFFDYDLDGDLDVFVMNHSLRYNGTFNERSFFDNNYDSLSADYLYENDEGKFLDVSKKAGIKQSVIGYGLGLCVADVNMDGWPDIYVGNDFQENDYLYINQKNGSFKENLENEISHTSQFSMGVDIADLNNDAFPEIVSLDMQPSDPYILKRSLGDDEYNLFNYKLKSGYNPQFARNCLQLNRGNNTFSDVAMYSGVEATDWSWSALFSDFNNDGRKDLFISNGIPKRMNDMDYISFLGNDEIQQKIRENKVNEKDMALVNKFPEIKLPNEFFLNQGKMKFENQKLQIDNNKPSFSNGAVYADFDNDGDVDVVVNNINDPVFLYENNSLKDTAHRWLSVDLKGDSSNRNAIGAKLLLFSKNEMLCYQHFAVKGFQSSMQGPLHIGLGDKDLDSMIVIWPDNGYEKLNSQVNRFISVKKKSNLPRFDYVGFSNRMNSSMIEAENMTQRTGLNFSHIENQFNEFDREQLMPKMVSREGPALAVADVNSDGLEDIFFGAAKFEKAALYFQQSNGRFIISFQKEIAKDSAYEDTDAVFVDVNNDGHKDLVVASGGNEFSGTNENQLPRVYINNGKGNFVKNVTAFAKDILVTASCVKPYDFDSDGKIDLFIAGRAVPWEYGKMPRSYLLKNDGKGNFTDVTNQYLKELAFAGMVTGAVWCDLDADKKSELVICTEWGGIDAYSFKSKSCTKFVISKLHGWWNCVAAIDINNDGQLDLVAGNLGENNRLRASLQFPVRMYYNDFDNNGKKEQVLTYHVEGKEIAFSNKDEITKQLPSLKKKFLFAENFAKASIEEIFTKQKLNTAEVFYVDYFSSAIFLNQGNFNFNASPLPWQAQLSTIREFAVADLDANGFNDLIIAGNFYPNNIQMGRHDADLGSVLLNDKTGNFIYQDTRGFLNKGESRHVQPIIIGKEAAFVFAKNNDSATIFKFQNFNKPGNKVL